jgi:choline dehydrogenase-like flavoprotein
MPSVGTEAVVRDLRVPHASYGRLRHAIFCWEPRGDDERLTLTQRSERVTAEREAFDVVIVGGGAAGCVVAARLSESASRSVLLLEAGPDLRANLPDDLRDGWHLSQQFDRGYAAEPDARGVVEDLRRGKLLGGTSWVTRFALRGSAADYDEWVALGNAGWGFEDVLPCFARLEADADFGDQPWHGDRGLLPITRYLDVERTEIAAAGLAGGAGGRLPDGRGSQPTGRRGRRADADELARRHPRHDRRRLSPRWPHPAEPDHPT